MPKEIFLFYFEYHGLVEDSLLQRRVDLCKIYDG